MKEIGTNTTEKPALIKLDDLLPRNNVAGGKKTVVFGSTRQTVDSCQKPGDRPATQAICITP